MMYVFAFVGVLLLIPLAAISLFSAILIVLSTESWVDHEEDKYHRQREDYK